MGSQVGILFGFDAAAAAADSGDCNIAILGVDLPYLSQEIPDDFTFGTRYMYVYTTMYYDT